MIVVGSFLKRGITSDRNNASNWFGSNEDGAELFSMIVPHLSMVIIAIFVTLCYDILTWKAMHPNDKLFDWSIG